MIDELSSLTNTSDLPISLFSDVILLKRLIFDPGRNLAHSTTSFYLAVVWRHFASDQVNLRMTNAEFLYFFKISALVTCGLFPHEDTTADVIDQAAAGMSELCR
jgi:hypothetical protein